jgi:hypothetical protein
MPNSSSVVPDAEISHEVTPAVAAAISSASSTRRRSTLPLLCMGLNLENLVRGGQRHQARRAGGIRRQG